MSFVFYDLTFLIAFTVATVFFLWRNWRRLGREGPIFLYRTQVGVKVMDKISKKCRKMLKPLSYVIIGLGYMLMIAMFYFLFQLINIFAKPEYVQVIRVPPLIPLIPYLPTLFKIEWLPPLYFTYWIVIIAVVAIVHEGFHGIYSRIYKVKVKSTGFGFLGPILTFFVDPDEKQIKRKSIKEQLTILGAGVFGNMLAALLFFFLMWLFFAAFYVPAGALFNTYSYAVAPVSALEGMVVTNESIKADGMNLTRADIEGESYFVLDEYLKSLDEYEGGYISLYYDLPAIRAGFKGAVSNINGVDVTNQKEIRTELNKYEPGERIVIQTKNKTGTKDYEIVLGEDYDTKGRAVIGIGVFEPELSGVRGFLYKAVNSFRNPLVYYEPKVNPELIEFIYYLLWWVVLVNIGVAMFNILPVGIADGGRFWYLTVLGITKNEKFARMSFRVITFLILFIFLLLMVLWSIGMY